MTIDFVIPGEPPTATAQQKGERVVNGKIVHYTKTKVKDAQEMYAWAARAALPSGWQPIPKPKGVRLYVAFAFGTDDLKKVGTWRTSRPDADNLVKALMDGFKDAGVWEDDSQVASLQVDKTWWSRKNACIHVQIEELEAKL